MKQENDSKIKKNETGSKTSGKDINGKYRGKNKKGDGIQIMRDLML